MDTFSEGLAVPGYEGRTLAVDQYYLHKFGLSRDGTEFKIGDFDLFGVPVSLSLSSGRFLLVLSQKEQKLFREYVNAPVRLFLRTRENRDERADLRIILINGKFLSLETLAHNDNLCLLELSYLHTPGVYRERLTTFFRDSDYFQEKYARCRDEGTPRLLFEKLLPDKLNRHGTVRLVQGEKRECSVLSAAPQEVELYLEGNGAEFPAQGTFSLELGQSGFSYFLKGEVRDFRLSAEAPGFCFVTAAVSYHPALLELLLPSLSASR